LKERRKGDGCPLFSLCNDKTAEHPNGPELPLPPYPTAAEISGKLQKALISYVIGGCIGKFTRCTQAAQEPTRRNVAHKSEDRPSKANGLVSTGSIITYLG